MISHSIEEYREETKRISDNIHPDYINLKVSIDGEIADAIDALQCGGNVCLTGYFGSGKTTVLRHFAALLAESRDRYPPIFVPMRNAPENLSGISARSFLQECALIAPPSELLDALEHGDSAFIILDGLDEMLLSSHSEFKNALSRWKAEYSESDWLLSTRPHFAAFIPETYTIAELLPLSNSQVEKYLAMRQHTDELHATISKFSKWPSLRALADNPLLLDVISGLNVEVGKIPSSRAELYSSCIDILMRGRDKTRGIPSGGKHFSLDQEKKLLSELALKMIMSNRNSVDQSDVLEVIPSELKRDDAQFTQEQILLMSSFTVKTGTVYFEFFHKSFQEYFAALAIASRSPSEAADILAQFDSDTLFEFLADLIERPEALITELVNRGQMNTALSLLDVLSPEQQIVKFYFLKQVAQRLGIANAVLPSSQAVIAKTTEVAQLWGQCKTTENPQSKGKYLEDFVEALFFHVFHIVNKDRLTNFGEIDLICEQRDFNAFWGRWQSDFFVECKNRKDKSPVSDINEFVGKATACNTRLCFFVSMTGFTDYAINSMRASWGKPGVPDIVWISGDDIELWLNNTETVDFFLKKMCRRANWGK